jgi:hypothetical protein
MAMKLGHIVATLPPAMLASVYLPAPAAIYESPGFLSGRPVEVVARVLFFGIAVSCSWANDWDLSRYRDRSHPGAAYARMTARAMYRLRTSRDLDRWEYLAKRFPDQEPPPLDLHRGPTHSIEWCLLTSGLIGGFVSIFPPFSMLGWWIGAAVFLGLFGHVVVDSLTPSGVPGSFVLNYLLYGECWRRHAVSLRWHEVGWGGVDDGDPITFRTPGIVPIVVRFWPLRLYREVPWVAMVTRTLQYPTPTLIPVDESSKGCRPGIFYTDGCAEKLGFVPVMVFSTLVLALVVTGTFRPTMWALTGWTMFSPAVA